MLVIRRIPRKVDKYRAYRIRVDGEEVGKVKDGKQVEIPISPGAHQVHLTIGRFWRSPAFGFVALPGRRTRLYCHASAAPEQALAWALRPGQYITLEPDDAEMRVVDVDERNGTLIVASYSLLPSSRWFRSGWMRTLTSEASDSELGEAVRAGLLASVPTDTEDLHGYDSPLGPMIAAVGAESAEDYWDGIRQVEVIEDPDHIECRAMKIAAGTRAELVDGGTFLPRDASAADLGSAVRLALTWAKPARMGVRP